MPLIRHILGSIAPILSLVRLNLASSCACGRPVRVFAIAFALHARFLQLLHLQLIGHSVAWVSSQNVALAGQQQSVHACAGARDHERLHACRPLCCALLLLRWVKWHEPQRQLRQVLQPCAYLSAHAGLGQLPLHGQVVLLLQLHPARECCGAAADPCCSA